MKKEEVPPDESFLASKNMRELTYAVDENGNYTTILSSGWAPKTLALNKSLEAITERAQDAKSRVLAGKTSPIEFYMELYRMDVPVLASYVNKWQWQVKRHFKPRVFQRLSTKTLARYAEAFGITIEELQTVKA